MILKNALKYLIKDIAKLDNHWCKEKKKLIQFDACTITMFISTFIP